MPNDSNEYVLCRTDSVSQALKGKREQQVTKEKLMELVKLLEKGEGGVTIHPTTEASIPFPRTFNI